MGDFSELDIESYKLRLRDFVPLLGICDYFGRKNYLRTQLTRDDYAHITKESHPRLSAFSLVGANIVYTGFLLHLGGEVSHFLAGLESVCP